MPKDWRKAINFVELVYDGQLLPFKDKISCAIFMEDCAMVHHNNTLKEWIKL